jgi:hypothetical protein
MKMRPSAIGEIQRLERLNASEGFVRGIACFVSMFAASRGSGYDGPGEKLFR